MPEAALVSLVMPASSSNIVGLRCPPFGCFRRMCCNRMASKASAKASLLWHQVVDVPHPSLPIAPPDKCPRRSAGSRRQRLCRSAVAKPLASALLNSAVASERLRGGHQYIRRSTSGCGHQPDSRNYLMTDDTAKATLSLRRMRIPISCAMTGPSRRIKRAGPPWTPLTESPFVGQAEATGRRAGEGPHRFRERPLPRRQPSPAAAGLLPSGESKRRSSGRVKALTR